MLKSLALALVSASAVFCAPPRSPVSELAARAANSGCDQGTCPDHYVQVDLLSTNYGNKWGYRMRDSFGAGLGGGCEIHESSEDGCNDIQPVGNNNLNVCIDWRSARGHIIDRDTGRRDCYHVATEYVCGNSLWTAWFDRQVDCTW